MDPRGDCIEATYTTGGELRKEELGFVRKRGAAKPTRTALSQNQSNRYPMGGASEKGDTAVTRKPAKNKNVTFKCRGNGGAVPRTEVQYPGSRNGVVGL